MTGASPDLWLGLDVGTQGTKALIVDASDGRSSSGEAHVVGRGAVSYGLIEGLPEGHMEQHPATWIEAIQGAVQAALKDAEASGVVGAARRVKGVGVSGQQHGAVLLDASHAPVRAAKLWCDTSTSVEAAELTREFGRAIPAGFTAPKLRYSARHEPEVWDRTRHVVLPHDYVNAWLTGEVFTEAGDASGTGYLRDDADLPSSGASHGSYAEGLDRIAPGLAERVPAVVPSNTVVAGLRAAAATALGLVPGIAVSGGGGDNMMSAIGSGATRPGVVTCSLGTSGTVFAYSSSRVHDPTGAVAAFRSSSEGAGQAPGHLPLLCVMNCTNVLNQVVELTGRGHDDLTAAASHVPLGCDGMLFVPYLVGERVPDLPMARGRLVGVSGALDAASLYRAAMEGVSLSLAMGLDRMRACGLDVSEVRLVGGAARNPLWRDLLASVFGCPVHLVQETETAALGGALQVASAVMGHGSADALSQRVVAMDPRVSVPGSSDAGAIADLKARFAAEVGTYSPDGPG